MPCLLGAIADDFTGATDLCNTLVRAGMRTVQLIGVPGPDLAIPDAEAITIALKSRTCPPAEAIDASRAAYRWLAGAGARQIIFKYCSTFDSTPEGNIGPVADMLLDQTGAGIAIACPAFPAAGRTIFKGHLFVGDRLLSDSPMRHHPLTPMTDANLVTVLAGQTRHKVGLVPHEVIREGPHKIAARLADLEAEGCRYAITDAIVDADLLAIGEALDGAPLVTGGSGIAMGLPANFRKAGLLGRSGDAEALPAIDGLEAVIAGSCSAATLTQIETFKARHPAIAIDPMTLADETPAEVARTLAWAGERLAAGPVLIYASAPPERVRAIQERFGREAAGTMIETALAQIARGLVDRGVRRLVVAGGETSGAVVQALGIKGLQIGPQIDPGVPATVTIGAQPPLALALKSGNFGGPGFLDHAFAAMPGRRA